MAAGGSKGSLAGRSVGHGWCSEGAGGGRRAGHGSGRGLRAFRPHDPGRAAEAGDAEGDAGAAPAAQGRGGPDPGAAAVRAAGGSGHAGERGLEEELDSRRQQQWEVGVSRDLPRWAQESEVAFLLRGPTGSLDLGCRARVSLGLREPPLGEHIPSAPALPVPELLHRAPGPPRQESDVAN